MCGIFYIIYLTDKCVMFYSKRNFSLKLTYGFGSYNR